MNEDPAWYNAGSQKRSNQPNLKNKKKKRWEVFSTRMCKNIVIEGCHFYTQERAYQERARILCAPGTFCAYRLPNEKWRHIRWKIALSGRIKLEYGIIVLSVSKMPIFRNRRDIFNALFGYGKQNFVSFFVISVFLKNRLFISYSKPRCFVCSVFGVKIQNRISDMLFFYSNTQSCN